MLRPSSGINRATADEEHLRVRKSGVARRFVAKRHVIARTGRDHTSVGARYGVATDLRFAWHMIECVEPAADSTASLKDCDSQPCFLQGECRLETGEASTDDEDVSICCWVQHTTDDNMVNGLL